MSSLATKSSTSPNVTSTHGLEPTTAVSPPNTANTASSSSPRVPLLASNHVYSPGFSPLNHVNCRLANARVARWVVSTNSSSSSGRHGPLAAAAARRSTKSIACLYPMDLAAGVDPGAIPILSIIAASSSIPSLTICSTRVSTRLYSCTRGDVSTTHLKSYGDSPSGLKLPTGRPLVWTISMARSNLYQSFSASLFAVSGSPASANRRTAPAHPLPTSSPAGCIFFNRSISPSAAARTASLALAAACGSDGGVGGLPDMSHRRYMPVPPTTMGVLPRDTIDSMASSACV